MGWAASNAAPDTVRAVVGAVVSGLGGIGSIAGVWCIFVALFESMLSH
jgi:hypothetical protein